MTRAISEQSEFYFEQTFHTLPSRPVFLIRSTAQAPFSFSIASNHEEKLSNRRLQQTKSSQPSFLPRTRGGEEEDRRKGRNERN